VLRFCLLDSNNQPILYFPASPGKVNVTVGSTPPPYVSATIAGVTTAAQAELSRYDANDNLVWFTDAPRATLAKTSAQQITDLATNGPKALKIIRVMLGDFDNRATQAERDDDVHAGRVDPPLRAARRPSVPFVGGGARRGLCRPGHRRARRSTRRIAAPSSGATT
jgi:hypothetical protein